MAFLKLLLWFYTPDENWGGSFGCSPLRKEIGIRQANKIDELSITWPGNEEPRIFKNIDPCQFIKIAQGNMKIVKVNLKKFDFEKQQTETISCSPFLLLLSNPDDLLNYFIETNRLIKAIIADCETSSHSFIYDHCSNLHSRINVCILEIEDKIMVVNFLL